MSICYITVDAAFVGTRCVYRDLLVWHKPRDRYSKLDGRVADARLSRTRHLARWMNDCRTVGPCRWCSRHGASTAGCHVHKPRQPIASWGPKRRANCAVVFKYQLLYHLGFQRILKQTHTRARPHVYAPLGWLTFRLGDSRAPLGGWLPERRIVKDSKA